MNRRGFATLIGGALAAPRAGWSQQSSKVYHIGVLIVNSRSAAAHLVAALEEGLRDYGYVVGRNVVIELRFADGKPERLPELAAELVRGSVDVIVVGTNNVTAAARSATQSIPIVFAVGTDVIGVGFVKSFAKPGGNITGLTWDVGEGTVSKAMELLKEAVPKIVRVAVLFEPPYQILYRKAVEDGASGSKVDLVWLESASDPQRGFAEAVGARANGAYVLGGPRLWGRRAEIAALAAKHHLPATYVNTEYVDVGGLMAYAPNVATSFRESARYIDKILKGAKPGDLPVEQPTKIDFVINLKAAKALGITFPRTILLRATRMIE